MMKHPTMVILLNNSLEKLEIKVNMNPESEESNPNIIVNMEISKSKVESQTNLNKSEVHNKSVISNKGDILDKSHVSQKSEKSQKSHVSNAKSQKSESSHTNKSNTKNDVSQHSESSDNKAKMKVAFAQDALFTGEMDSGGSDRSDSENSEVGDKIALNMMGEKKVKHNLDEIYDFYEELRNKFKEKGHQWEDPEFPNHETLFYVNEEKPDHLKNYSITFAAPEETTSDDPFFSTDSGHNIHYEFKIKRGVARDKFFISSILMLFKRREEFFTNLIIDYEHIKENIKAGFCGFRFFINGEWQNVTVDTQLPWHQNDETALSVGESTKTNFWLTLFEKAYAKVMGTYDALNDVSIKNTLVELTGGISKKIKISEKSDETEKKKLFEDLRRWVNQKYLLGCMRFNESEEDVKIKHFNI
jgi:hypothetical protein